VGSFGETDFHSFEDVLQERPFTPQAQELANLEAGFLRRVATQYFKVCAEAIREWDPHHLILGCRYAGYAPDEVVQSMGDNVDVVSYNHYDFRPPVEKLRQIHAWTGKPVMLTEFSFKARDSGLPNTRGAGQPVETQVERADGFEAYVTALLQLPFAVGFHWFEYAEELCLALRGRSYLRLEPAQAVQAFRFLRSYPYPSMASMPGRLCPGTFRKGATSHVSLPTLRSSPLQR